MEPERIQLKVINIGLFVANPRILQQPEDNILEGRLRIGSRGLKLQDAELVSPRGFRSDAYDLERGKGRGLV